MNNSTDNTICKNCRHVKRQHDIFNSQCNMSKNMVVNDMPADAPFGAQRISAYCDCPQFEPLEESDDDL